MKQQGIAVSLKLMNKSIAKNTIKVLGGVLGLFGISMMLMTISFISSENSLLISVLLSMSFILIGLVLFLVGYILIKNFSLKSIQSLCTAIALIFVGFLFGLIDTITNSNGNDVISILGALISSVLIYQLLTHFVIKWCDIEITASKVE